MDKFTNRYYMFAAGYGMCRKVYELKDATTVNRVYDNTSNKAVDKELPILLGDKLLLTCYATMLSPFLIPMHIKTDINQLQIYIQGLDHNDFELHKKRSMSDYICS
jgi:hypothetical protein